MTLEISNEEFQVCSSFPNDNSKCIDFVLFYEENLFQQNENVVEENRIRSEFFTQLKIEKIDSYDLEFERDEKYKKVIKLLHCSLDRLFREAEKIKLEMPLKKNVFKNYVVIFHLSFLISNYYKIDALRFKRSK